jgi:hypothetical protein
MTDAMGELPRGPYLLNVRGMVERLRLVSEIAPNTGAQGDCWAVGVASATEPCPGSTGSGCLAFELSHPDVPVADPVSVFLKDQR